MDDNTELYIGLMSGTSADGVDAALCSFSTGQKGMDYDLIEFVTEPYDESLSDRLERVPDLFTQEIADLNMEIGRRFSEVVQTLLDRAGIEPGRIRCIGSHGHTVFHQSDTDCTRTLQVGEAAVIAERTSIPVISDFRPADIAAGGEGAPLIPKADDVLWRNPDVDRVLVNLGGFVNPTVLPATGDVEEIVAFDAGPCNVLLNDLAQRAGVGPFDENGQHALKGTPIESLVEAALADPYFDKPPPKSTGTHEFGTEWVDRWLGNGMNDVSAEALLATGNRLIARILSRSLEMFLSFSPDEVLLTGGGRHNRALVKQIRSELESDMEVYLAEEMDMNGDAREAIAFALFAYLSEHNQAGTLPAATGASRPVVPGKRTPPTGRPGS